MGRVTRTTVDKLNRATAVVDARGGQTSFAYDPNSNLTSLTDALMHATTYAYDDSDRVSTRTDPLNHAGTYEYDGNNNLTQMTDRKSQVTSRTYDPLNRLKVVTFADASTIECTYDAGDRLLEIDDSTNGTITRTYDDRDRLTSETTAEGTVSYTYDDADRRATVTVTGQMTVEYGYDDANRLTSITRGSAVVRFTYDDANRRSTLAYPNGIVATYGYDSANQLTSLSYTSGMITLGDLAYTYDAAGQRRSVGGSWARTAIPQALSSATYDAANRIVTWSGTAFTYDPNGNLTSDGAITYSWNARNQLSAMSGGTSASFAYDALRRRQSKTLGGTTTNFLYDGWNFVQELTTGGTPTANLFTGLGIDQIFMRADSTGTSSLLVDGLGSTLELADSSGTLQTHYTFEPFGATTTSGATSTNAQAFTGRENDGTGLYFYRARFYSPGLQRFLAEDPLEFGGGDVNLSAYVRNDPVSKTDPFGLYVKNCTDQPKKVKPEHGGEPPFILPPMTECPDCHPDGVAPVSPDAPWTKVPSPERWPADVTIYPPMRVVCSWTSLCGYPPLRPYIPAAGSADDRNMRADPDWWKSPVELPPERKKPLGRKDCDQ